jgi:hypothetical protein
MPARLKKKEKRNKEKNPKHTELVHSLWVTITPE